MGIATIEQSWRVLLTDDLDASIIALFAWRLNFPRPLAAPLGVVSRAQAARKGTESTIPRISFLTHTSNPGSLHPLALSSRTIRQA